MRRVTLLDTSVAANNQGDRIIMQAVRKEISQLLPDAFVVSVASHEWMGRTSRRLIRRADWALAGGTNLLSSHMWLPRVWKLSPRDGLAGLALTLMGVGWYQFQGKPDPYSRWLIRSVLRKDGLHGVRDGYTQSMLAGIGITNCVNIGCPTLWSLTPEHCRGIPETRSDTVVTAVNTYMPDPAADAEMIRVLRQQYETVYFWIQTDADFEYSKSLDPSLEYLPPNLEGFDAFLRETQADYVGNRLHAGIRALQHGRRSIIVEIDNRAREMGRDFALPVVARRDVPGLEARIEGRWETRVRLPVEAIASWRGQFESAPGVE